MAMRSRYTRPLGLAIGRLVAEGHSLGDITKRLPSHQPGISRWKRQHPELATLHAIGSVLKLLNRVGELDDRWRRVRDELEAALYAPARDQDALLDPLLEKLRDLLGSAGLAAAARNDEGREAALRLLAQHNGDAAEG